LPGYAAGLYDTYHNLPVVRHGLLALTESFPGMEIYRCLS
jgi:hypothetical protein